MFGQPTHQDLTGAEVESVKWVPLHFASVGARRRFAETAEKVCNIMRNSVDVYHRDLRETRNLTLYTAN